MANESLGHIDCPTCGASDATVHREKRGKRALYIRCYEADGMTARCGTLQCRGPAGQSFVEKNARWHTPEGQDNAAAEAAEVERERATDNIRSERRKHRGLGERIAAGARSLAEDDGSAG